MNDRLLALIVSAGDLAAWYAARKLARDLRHAELALRVWAADPANWCDRPGCPRCWGGWGR